MPITSSEDILNELGFDINTDKKENAKDNQHNSREENIILKLLEKPMSRDELIRELNIETNIGNQLLTVMEIKGLETVEAVEIKDLKTDEPGDIKTDAIFVLIGISPNSAIVKDMVKLDEKGCIVADDDMRTSADGIFACGDVRKKTLRQIITAAGDGAAAAFSAEQYIESLKPGGR